MARPASVAVGGDNAGEQRIEEAVGIEGLRRLQRQASDEGEDDRVEVSPRPRRYCPRVARPRRPAQIVAHAHGSGEAADRKRCSGPTFRLGSGCGLMPAHERSF